MVNKLLKNYHIKKTLAILFLILVLLSSIANSYINYTTNKSVLYENIDQKLKTAALGIELILDDDFFDKAINKKSITSNEDKENILKISKFTNILDVEYVYTMFQKDKKIYFTSSSATDKELQTQEMTRYFDYYEEATDILLNLVKYNKLEYEESTDKWGTFRTILIPRKTKNGVSYIIGADIKIDLIQEDLDKFLYKIIITQLIILLFVLMFSLLFIKISKKELNDIGLLNKQLDEDIEEKTQKLAELNTHLKQKVKEEVDKNRKKDQHLIEHSRLIQMGEMISMIAHQWRQPLNAISAATILIDLRIGNKTFDIEVIQKSTENINKYIKYLSNTIDDFRDFFKPKKEMIESDFSVILNKVLSLNEYSIKESKIKLEIDRKSILKFSSYENELVQVIINIIKNAEDILKEKQINNPIISIIIQDNILSIEDNAGGIDEKIIDNIFDPYFSTKGKNGTGLGLYMSKIIIQEHCKGELSVVNTNSGAKFSIVMPLSKD